MYHVEFTPTAAEDLAHLNNRVLYTFSKAETSITVHFVRHRREVYKTK